MHAINCATITYKTKFVSHRQVEFSVAPWQLVELLAWLVFRPSAQPSTCRHPKNNKIVKNCSQLLENIWGLSLTQKHYFALMKRFVSDFYLVGLFAFCVFDFHTFGFRWRFNLGFVALLCRSLCKLFSLSLGLDCFARFLISINFHRNGLWSGLRFVICFNWLNSFYFGCWRAFSVRFLFRDSLGLFLSFSFGLNFFPRFFFRFLIVRIWKIFYANLILN